MLNPRLEVVMFGIKSFFQKMLSSQTEYIPVNICFLLSDSNDYLSTSSQADSLLDDSSRIDPECGSLSSQSSFSKEETGLIGICSLLYLRVSCR